MADSLEYKTVLSCFDKLVTALKLDPLAVSNGLVAEYLIPPVDGAVDAQKLAQLLLERIQLSPKRYYDVIKVFSRNEWMSDIVDILQEEHSKVEGASVGVRTLGDEEATVWPTTLKEPVVGEETESKSERSISPEGASENFNTLFDFPHEQSSLLIPNPVVRFEKLTEDDCIDLSAQMGEMQDRIRNTFAKVSHQVYKSLKTRVQHDCVVLTLTKGSDLFDKDDVNRLHEATTMYEVFQIMDPHYSYFNHDPLKLLVKVHGTPEDKKCFDDYLKSFANYCRAMPCAEEICGSGASQPNRVKIKFKLNFDRQRLKADYVKDNIIRNIARILKIKPSSLYLRSIKEGCVSLEFMVPPFLCDRIFPLSDDQVVSLYSKVKVTAIQCDQRSLHVDVETDAKHLIEQKKLESGLKADIGSTASGQATSGHISGASPVGYALMQPPKEVPAEYQRASTVPGSDPLSPTKLHKMEGRQAPSSAHPLVGSSGVGSTTSSATSSRYFGSASSVGSVKKKPEIFDYSSFFKKLSEVKRRDPQWKQFMEEEQHHWRERDKLNEGLERDLARSKWLRAYNQQLRRESELMKDLLSHELKTATSDAVKIKIQCRLEETEGEIRERKEKVEECDDKIDRYEHKIDEYEESLAQLRQGSQAASALSSGASVYSLMEPPVFLHFLAEYQRAVHQLHKVEEKRAASVPHRPRLLLPVMLSRGLSRGAGGTAVTSSGSLSIDFSTESVYQVMETAEIFDDDAFSKKLSEMKRRDPQWIKFEEDFQHHAGEYSRLCKEVKQLEHQVNEAKDKESKKDTEPKLKLKTLIRDLAYSNLMKAYYQGLQRASELERDLLSQALKTATNDALKIKIQRQLEEVEGKIRERKEKVKECVHRIDEYEESLAQLRKESHLSDSAGPTLVSKLSSDEESYEDTLLQTYYVTESSSEEEDNDIRMLEPSSKEESDDIPVLKTEPSITITPASSSSPATAHYTCPSCGVQYQGDKGLYSGGERCASCSGSDGKQQTE